MRALATWCVRHRRLVAAFWVTAFIVVTLVSRSVGSAYTDTFSLPNTQSTEAIKLLQQASPKISGDQEQVVFETNGSTRVSDSAVRDRITAMLDRVRQLPHVTEVASPYSAIASSQVSSDGRIAFAIVTFDKQSQDISSSQAKTFVNTARSADSAAVTVAVAGQIAEEANPQSVGGTGLGVLLAGVVLLLVFGSVFAMALPLISAAASLGTAIGLIGLISHLVSMPTFAPELVLLIGLGVGVDYALFIVTRHRQGLIAGREVERSIVTAVDTSGRAVLFAGIVVCIALLGMFAIGVSFLYGMAIAASIGVAFTMLSALTLLPAMLGFIGPRVLSRRQKKRLISHGARIVGTGGEGFWSRWAATIQRRPIVAATAASVIIVLLALPFFSLRLGTADQGSDPVGTTTRQAYDILVKGFGPGFNGPLQIVALSRDSAGGAGASDTLQQQAVERLKSDVSATKGVSRVVGPVSLPTKNGSHLWVLIAYPTTAPQAAATTSLIGHLRQSTVPEAVSGSGVTVDIGGTTAILVDFSSVLSSKLPFFIGLVVLLSFILLAVVFRSVVIPLTAAAMNILSVGAALGILVAVFQYGWLGGIFGVNRTGPIETFVPVMLFAILFGLSMDYEVFLLARIHEEWMKCQDNRVAVQRGLAATGKTITAAAFIMVLVFGSFILGGERVIKEFGVGLAAGILVDAVIIRMAIVPALMQLFGKANWWFPRRLDRILPHFSVDHNAELDATAPVEPERVREPVSV